MQSLHKTEGNNKASIQWNTLLYPPKWKPAAIYLSITYQPTCFSLFVCFVCFFSISMCNSFFEPNYWHPQHPAEKQWELSGKNISWP